MKALYYIFGIALLTVASCSSGLYVGTEYDDLYYLSSDQPVTQVRTTASRPVSESNLKSGAYYDNIYANDTLVSQEYSDAADSDEALGYNNYNYNYYDNYSYAGRLNRFYGNYFNPYWRDPFYYSWYPSFGFNNYYYGFPYSYGYYDPFYYDYYSPYSYGGFYNSAISSIITEVSLEGITTTLSTVHGIHHTIMAGIIPTISMNGTVQLQPGEKGPVPFQLNGQEAFPHLLVLRQEEVPMLLPDRVQLILAGQPQQDLMQLCQLQGEQQTRVTTQIRLLPEPKGNLPRILSNLAAKVSQEHSNGDQPPPSRNTILLVGLILQATVPPG